ncbi:hypothetical protein DF3PB_140013 [uncultured Defluviicoccus sp.]|uniref:Uncharacterized protein n=1 Tax=metagenome TaxID=256318 RepID=A0A380T944_9ZZZZ|nr:hypothetical protein DF3PB_140013 [uncultured Defluviicoccus sp.]
MTYQDEKPQPGQCDLTELERQLEELRQKLLDSQGELQTTQGKIKEHQDQIKDLEALIPQFGPILDGYRTRYEELKKKQEKYDKYCHDERGCLEQILGPIAQKVHEILNKIHEDIARLKKEIAEMEKQCNQLKAERDTAKAEMDAAKSKLDLWRTPAASIDARHKQLDDIKKLLDAERQQHNYAMAYYFLIGKQKYCDKVDDPPQVLTLDQLCEKLKSTWSKYQEAHAIYNTKDGEVNRCETQLATKKSQLEQDQKNLEANIRRKLMELGRDAPPAPTTYATR